LVVSEEELVPVPVVPLEVEPVEPVEPDALFEVPVVEPVLEPVVPVEPELMLPEAEPLPAAEPLLVEVSLPLVAELLRVPFLLQPVMLNPSATRADAVMTFSFFVLMLCDGFGGGGRKPMGHLRIHRRHVGR
jgi:hypothetical protein